MAIPLGLVLACLLLAGFASTASATPYDIRGEWAFELTAPKQPTLSGAALLDKLEPSGEFSGSGLLAGFIKTTVSGTISGSEASVTMVAEAPGEDVTFIASKVTLDTVKNTFTGTGAYFNAKHEEVETGEVKAVQIKSYQQIEKEQQEKEARANIRGEWALTLEAGPEKLQGTAIVTEEASAKNEFASKSALFESVMGGTFTGTLKGSEASVNITTEGYAPMSIPPGNFTSETIAVSSSADPTSMSGEGTFTIGALKTTGKLTATRIKTYQQVLEREASERELKERQEQEAQEAKEKLEKELKEKAEQAAKEQREREGRESVEKAKVAIGPIIPPLVIPPSLEPVLLASKALTVSQSGGLSLQLTNPNSGAAHGHLKLTMAKAAKASKTKQPAFKGGTLGEASFSLAGGAKAVVKVKLSHSGRTELGHLKTMHVLVAITTELSGQPATVKTYSLTLRAPTPAHKKG
jgi:hypothetical protein